MTPPQPGRSVGRVCVCSMVALLTWLGPAPSRATEEGQTVEVTIDQKDLKGAETVTTKTTSVGDTLVVRLEFQATGYVWKLTRNDPEALRRDREGPPETERDRNVPGAPEYKVYRFKVLKPGELEFQLARPFGNPDARVVRLKVDVQE